MNEASYFDLKNRIFATKKDEECPILTGTPINWGNSWMKPLHEYCLECTDTEYDII